MGAPSQIQKLGDLRIRGPLGRSLLDPERPVEQCDGLVRRQARQRVLRGLEGEGHEPGEGLGITCLGKVAGDRRGPRGDVRSGELLHGARDLGVVSGPPGR